MGDHADFGQEEQLGFDHDLGQLCRGRHIHISGHSDMGILSNLERPPILLECGQIRRRLLVRHNQVILQ